MEERNVILNTARGRVVYEVKGPMVGCKSGSYIIKGQLSIERPACTHCVDQRLL